MKLTFSARFYIQGRIEKISRGYCCISFITLISPEIEVMHFLEASIVCLVIFSNEEKHKELEVDETLD